MLTMNTSYTNIINMSKRKNQSRVLSVPLADCSAYEALFIMLTLRTTL